MAASDKMLAVSKSKLDALADAIKEKTGKTDNLTIDEMTAEVAAYSSADTSDATATAADIVSGKTAYIASGKVKGTMPTYGGETRDTVEFRVDIYGTADDPSSTMRVESYTFSTENGDTFMAYIDCTDWSGKTVKLSYTQDDHKMVYLSESGGDYALAIQATEVIECKSYQANWSVIGG